MTLTAEDVRSTEFRVVLRGYAVQEVDDFLDQIEDSLRQLHGTGTREVSGAGSRADTRLPAAAPGLSAEEPFAHGARILQLAEQTAEQLVSEAQAEAAQLVHAADEESGRRRDAADVEATHVLRTASQEAERLLTEARAESRALSAEATASSRREAEELQQQVSELRAEVASLQRLEHTHRDRMVSLLTEQLRLLQPAPLRAVPAVGT